MKAGIELDIKVAKAMGIKVYDVLEDPPDDAIYPYITKHIIYPEETKITLIKWDKPETDGWHWSPSSDIKAAWEVVEELDDWEPLIKIQFNEDGVKSYKASMYDENLIRCIASADTAPLAICLAALEAVK